MLRFIKLYGYYVFLWFSSQKEYKVSFFFGFLANFYCYTITYALFWVITNRFQSIGNWVFPEISILYSFNLLIYAITGTLIWGSVYHLERMIIDGSFDRFLLRPVGLFTQLMCSRFGYTFLGQIVVSLIFLITNLIQLEIELTLLKLIFIILSLAGSIAIHAGAMIFVGSFSFFTLKSQTAGDIFYYDLRDFINYPLSIFPGFIKVFLTFVLPWAFINYYPVALLLNKSSGTDAILGFISPIVGALFLFLSVKLFYFGLKRYSSTGS